MEIQYKTKHGIRIYSIEYLINNELSEEDIEFLFDRSSGHLKYSIIVGMFEYAGIKKTLSEIIRIIRKENKWYDRYEWTQQQCAEYEKLLAKAIHNIYSYSYTKSKSIAQWYISIYGLKVKGNSIDL